LAVAISGDGDVWYSRRQGYGHLVDVCAHRESALNEIKMLIRVIHLIYIILLIKNLIKS
jgi:hypothetical protein